MNDPDPDAGGLATAQRPGLVGGPGPGSSAAVARAATRGTRAALALGTSVALMAVVGLLGPSDVAVRLARSSAGRPPFNLGLATPAWLAVGLTALALMVGAGGLLTALRAMRGGWLPHPGRWLAGGIGAALLSLLVPPAASGDALIYAAYGRIAALGGDPYVDSPRALIAFGDPIGKATERPWQGVTSVYGPVATAVQEAASRLGGTSMQRTVEWLAVANVLAWVGAGLLLLALADGDRAVRSRVLVLYWANPLLLWAGPFGGHNDSQALVFAVAALLALRSRVAVLGAALSGALIGLAGAVKLTEGVVGLGLLWAVRRRPAAALALCTTAAAVLLVAYLPHWPEAFRQTSSNSSFISSASPWRWARQLLDLALTGSEALRVVSVAAWAAVATGAVLLFRRLTATSAAPVPAAPVPAAPVSAAPVSAAPVARPAPGRSGLEGRARVVDAARAVVAVSVAWVVLGSYTLPWYDMVAWSPLTLLAASALDVLLLVRTATVCLAYVATREVPRDLAPSRSVAFLANHVRDTVSPLVHIGLAVALYRWAGGRPGRRSGHRRRA